MSRCAIEFGKWQSDIVVVGICPSDLDPVQFGQETVMKCS